MGDVIQAGIHTTIDMPAEKVLGEAIEAKLQPAIVIGWTADGKLYFAGTTSNVPEVLHLIELAKLELLGVKTVD